MEEQTGRGEGAGELSGEGLGQPQMDETIQFLKAALTPVTAVTAVIGCWIPIRQYRTKQLELRLARYDKRFKVYQALKDFIADVIDNPKISADAVRRFD